MANYVDFREVAKIAWIAERAACIQGAIAADHGSWESLTEALKQVEISAVQALAHGSRMAGSDTLSSIGGNAAAKRQAVFDDVALEAMRIGR